MAHWLLDKLKFPTQDFKTVGNFFYEKLRPKVDTFKRDYETIRQPAKKEISKYFTGKAFKPVDIGKRLIETAPQTYRDTKRIGSWAFSKLRKTPTLVPKIGETVGEGITSLAFGDVRRTGISGIPEHIWETEKEISRFLIKFVPSTYQAFRHPGKVEKKSLRLPILGEIETFQKSSKRTFDNIIDGKEPLWHALAPFIEVPFSATFTSGLLKSGARKALKGIKVNSNETSVAIKKMGLKDLSVEAQKKQYRKLAHETHPDVGGSQKAFSELNEANQILNKARRQGLLFEEKKLAMSMRKMSEAGLTEIKKFSDINKLKKIFRTTEQPYLGVRGLLPEQAGTLPTRPFQARQQPMGLSIRDIEAKPITKISKELEPLKPTKDIKSFKDFYYEEKGLKKVYKPIIDKVDDINVYHESTCVDCEGGADFVDSQMDKAIELPKKGKWAKKIKEEWADRLKDYDTHLYLTDEYLIFEESAIENFYKLSIQPKTIIPPMENFYNQAVREAKPIKQSDKFLETMRRPKATDDIVELEPLKDLAKKSESFESFKLAIKTGSLPSQDVIKARDLFFKTTLKSYKTVPDKMAPTKLGNELKELGIKNIEDFYNKAVKPTLPKADPLITEARKYKSAEDAIIKNVDEFVAPKDSIVFRGQPKDTKLGRFFTTDETIARGYGEQSGVGRETRKIDISNKKFINRERLYDKINLKWEDDLVKEHPEIFSRIDKEFGIDNILKKELERNPIDLADKIEPFLRKKGFSGLFAKDDKQIILFESQLTDIYNKAKALPEAKIKPVVKIKAEEGVKGLPTKKEAKILSAKDILDRRRFKVKAVKEHFGLTDNELRKISRKDIRLMDNFEFKKFIDDMRIKAEKLGERKQAMNEIIKQTMDKELDVENLRKAMKLPTMKNMTITDIKKLDEAIKPFQKGDEFLSVRKLEVVDRTELKGIKTWREAREKLAKRLNVPVEELQNIKVSEFDRFRYDTALAERNPFYKMMVEESAGKMLVSEAEYLKLEQKVFTLAKGLKPKGITGRVIPQQKNIRAFMEARPEDRAGIILTETEDKLVKLMTKEFEDVRNYLIQMEAMKMGKENYFTHIRRGVLEAAKEDGVVKAFKEIFEQYKMEEQAFNILDKKTGEILAMDKFFKFAMHRTGEIKPTENTVKAFLTYMKTFKKKQALDEIVPLVDIYAQALTPKGLTKKGVLLHGNLQTFVKEWLNTKKGRHITLMAKQNGKIDGALRTIKMFTSLRDLGLNLPVSIASEVGEQVTTYQLLGKGRFALGKIRQNTKQGKVIIEKYRNLIGKNPWRELVEPSKEAGDRLMEGIFILFRDASTRANKTFLLGSLSKQEFKTGIITPQRLSALRTELGRYRMVQGMKSIIGTTPEGGAYTQYKTWAIPIIRTNIKNLEIIGKKLAGQNKGSSAWKKSILELYREVEITAFAMLAFSLVRDEDDNSFVGQIINKMYRESTTLIQALQPKMFLTAGRTASFITELGENLTSILLWEEYKTKEGLKGVERFKKQITPVVVSQFLKEQKTEYKKAVSEDKEKSDKEKKEFKPTYDKIQKLENEGNTDEMWKIINNLSDNEYEIYKKFLTSTKTKATNKAKEDFYPTFKKIQDLENEGKTKEMWAMINRLTEEEYKIYEKFVKKFD